MHSHDRTILARLAFADPDKANPMHDLACQYIATAEVSRKIAGMLYADDISSKDVEMSIGQEYWIEGNRLRPKFVGTRSGQLTSTRCQLERPLVKGEGQYQTIVGFLDVVVSAEIEHSYSGTKTVVEKVETYFADADGREITSEQKKNIEMSLIDKHKIVCDSKFEDYMPNYCHRCSRYLDKDPGWPKKLRRNVTASTPVRFTDRYGASENKIFVVEVKIIPVGAGDVLRQINLYRQFMRASHWIVATAFPLSPTDSTTFKEAGIISVRLGESFNKWVAEQESLRIAQESSGDPGDSIEI